jgi:hypothetical protein
MAPSLAWGNTAMFVHFGKNVAVIAPAPVISTAPAAVVVLCAAADVVVSAGAAVVVVAPAAEVVVVSPPEPEQAAATSARAIKSPSTRTRRFIDCTISSSLLGSALLFPSI